MFSFTGLLGNLTANFLQTFRMESITLFMLFFTTLQSYIEHWLDNDIVRFDLCFKSELCGLTYEMKSLDCSSSHIQLIFKPGDHCLC